MRSIPGSAPCPSLSRSSPKPPGQPERMRGSTSQSHKSTHHTDIFLSSPYTNPHSLMCTHMHTHSQCVPNGRHKHLLSWGPGTTPHSPREADVILVLGGSQVCVVSTLASTHKLGDASVETHKSSSIYWMSGCYAPGVLPLCILAHLILSTSLWGKPYHPQFGSKSHGQ